MRTMTKDLTDAQLVEQVLENTDLLEVLFDRYEKRLLYYILRISSFDMLSAEEILQEVFLKIWKNLQGYDPSISFSSWVYRIAHNETISQFRKSKTRGEDQQSVWDDEHINSIADVFNIESQVDQGMSNKIVQKVLVALDPKYKEILVLRFFEDLSYQEISDVLKKPEGTIATLISRAKKQFSENYIRITHTS